MSHIDGGYARGGLHVGAYYAGCTLQDNGIIITLILKKERAQNRIIAASENRELHVHVRVGFVEGFYVNFPDTK